MSELSYFLADLLGGKDNNRVTMAPTIVADNAKMHYNEQSVQCCSMLLEPQRKKQTEPVIDDDDETNSHDLNRQVASSTRRQDVSNTGRWEACSPTMPPQRCFNLKQKRIRNDAAMSMPNRVPSPMPPKSHGGRRKIGRKQFMSSTTKSQHSSCFVSYQIESTAAVTSRIVDLPPVFMSNPTGDGSRTSFKENIEDYITGAMALRSR